MIDVTRERLRARPKSEVSSHLSDLSGIPKDVVAGVVSAGAKPSDALGAVSAIRAGVFDDLNAVMANDIVTVTVPAGVKMLTPLHVVQLSTAYPSGDKN